MFIKCIKCGNVFECSQLNFIDPIIYKHRMEEQNKSFTDWHKHKGLPPELTLADVFIEISEAEFKSIIESTIPHSF